jgi:hypothetical protein
VKAASLLLPGLSPMLMQKTSKITHRYTILTLSCNFIFVIAALSASLN